MITCTPMRAIKLCGLGTASFRWQRKAHPPFLKIIVDKFIYRVYISCMKRINIHLTKQQIERLKNLAIETGLKIAELIRRAIDEYLEKTK